MLSHMSQRAFVTALGLVSLSLGACDNGSLLSEIAQDIAQHQEPGGKKPPEPCGTGGPAGSGGAGGTACVSAVQSSDTSCKDTYTWKQAALADCQKQGLILSDYGTADACGKDAFRSVKYLCCPTTAPTPAPSCTDQTQGSETSCKSSTDWKQYATDSCAAAGLVLGSVEPTGDCGKGGTRYVKYTCCPPAAPPPPPPASSCIDQSQGSEVSCKSAADWKQYASQSCTAAGLALISYEPTGDCGDGGTRYVKYVCCK